jgi:hypothetical protein
MTPAPIPAPRASGFTHGWLAAYHSTHAASLTGGGTLLEAGGLLAARPLIGSGFSGPISHLALGPHHCQHYTPSAEGQLAVKLAPPQPSQPLPPEPQSS